MTKEELKTIYDRAVQYVIAKYNKTPKSIQIEDDGTLSAEYLYEKGCCGDPDDYSWFYFNVDDLSSDLDALVIERKAKEEKEKQEEQLRQENIEKARITREKENRRMTYMKLKKEFENE